MLRKFEERDTECLARLRNDWALQHLLLGNPVQVADSNLLTETCVWALRRHNTGFFRIVESQDGTAVGFAQVSNIHNKNRNGWMGLALIREVRGQGIGAQTVNAIEKAAFQTLGLRKLLLEVRIDNSPAIALYTRLGWREVGCLTSHYDDGTQLHDVLIYERHLGSR